MTLSGEVLMQAPFATQLLKRLRRYGIHTAIETAGDAPLSRLLPLARQCDEVLFDLKIMDPEHAFGDGSKSSQSAGKPYAAGGRRHKRHPRVPLIPGYTLTDANMASVLAFYYLQGYGSCIYYRFTLMVNQNTVCLGNNGRCGR